MNPADLEQLRPGRPGCPPEVTLHRLRAGELTGEQAQATRRHVDGCEDCAARVARLESGFAAWPEADPVRMLAAIRREASERPRGLARLWRRWPGTALAPLAAAVAVALVVALRPGADSGLATREKGGPTLHVFRQRSGVAMEALSGEHFAPGEPLQLTVDLPSDGLVRIIGIEASGDLYPIWPRDGEEPFARMKAGRGQRVPGAIAPDEKPGRETFHVIACAPRPTPPACRSRGAAEPPACSDGCLTSPFVIVKGK